MKNNNLVGERKMAELIYSAGMVSQVFAFVETKQTAELMAA